MMVRVSVCVSCKLFRWWVSHLDCYVSHHSNQWIALAYISIESPIDVVYLSIRIGICGRVVAHSGTIRSYRFRVCHVPLYYRVRTTSECFFASGKPDTVVLNADEGTNTYSYSIMHGTHAYTYAVVSALARACTHLLSGCFPNAVRCMERSRTFFLPWCIFSEVYSRVFCLLLLPKDTKGKLLNDRVPDPDPTS